MSLKKIFGLENESITDEEIALRIEDAQRHNLSKIAFTKEDGSRIEVSIVQTPYYECGIMD